MTNALHFCRIRAAIFSAVMLGALVGCAGSSGTTGTLADAGADNREGGAAGDGGSVVQDCSGVASSQTVSQPCCLASGIDACGANLFCAAFDGRKQPTCYLERSRLDMTECSEDRQCMSGACSVEARSAARARAAPTAEGQRATGADSRSPLAARRSRAAPSPAAARTAIRRATEGSTKKPRT